MRELLARPAFRRLLVGQAVSGLGDWMGTVALMVMVLDITHSSTAVGGVLVLRLLPSLVAAPIAARASDRFSRRRVMLTMDAARALIVAVLPLFTYLSWVYTWAFVLEVASLVFLPARDACVPVLAGVAEDERARHGGDAPPEEHRRAEERLGTANALILGSSYGGIPLAAGLFGLVFWLTKALGGGEVLGGRVPFLVVFWLDAVTFLVSYLAIRAIRVGETDDRTPETADHGGFLAGLRLPIIRGVLPGVACVTLGIGALFSVGVSYVERVLHAGAVQFGLLIACFGLGACGALGWRRLLGDRGAFVRLRVGIVVQGLVITGMSLTGTTPLALLGAFLYGLFGTTVLIAGMSLLQERLKGHQRDLAFTAVHVTIRAGLALAALAAGAAADLVSPVRWGIPLKPAQLVLCCAGIVVVLGAVIVREPEEPGDSDGPDRHDLGLAAGRREAVGDPSRPPHPRGGRKALPRRRHLA